MHIILYLVGGLEYFLCFQRLGTITPTDFHLFQRGRYTTNQILLHMCDARLVKINAIPQHFFQIHHPVLQSFHCNQMKDKKRSAKSQVLSFGWFLTIHICTYINCRYISIVYIYIYYCIRFYKPIFTLNSLNSIFFIYFHIRSTHVQSDVPSGDPAPGQ